MAMRRAALCRQATRSLACYAYIRVVIATNETMLNASQLQSVLIQQVL